MSVIVVAVDPGIRGCGVAVFRDGTLVAAAYVPSSDTKGNQVAACVAAALAVWRWLQGVLGLPAGGPLPAVLRWLRVTFPTATAWVASVLGVDAQVAQLPDVLACEWPRMYYGSKQSGDQNDLPPLAGVDCALGGLFPHAELVSYYPDEWKGGQVPKKVMNDRVWGRLSAMEQGLVDRRPRGGLDHNCLDAIGVGLRYLGRLDRRRAYG